MKGNHSMKRISITLAAALFSIALPLAAVPQQDPVFVSYEAARQALIKGSVPDVKKAARHVSVSARSAAQHNLVALAATMEKAADLKAARAAFAAVSEEVIRYRESRRSNRPVVAYCSMEKKSWLQPEGEIGNPYVDASMRRCGEIKSPPKDSSSRGGHIH